ncbi:amidase [Novosphingobium huizhouense]|uniref:amidase n=1 Tax=Novosphingobium huizhouense TaxID=2866625 RepID=UPI001CD8C0FB|nr:amidase [Novosphingobium huizhouense]
MRRSAPCAILLSLAAAAAPACAAPPVTQPAGPSAVPSVADYRARIAAIDDAGPMINAVIALNPDAEAQEAVARKVQGPLAGRAVLVKDNIETRDAMATTAGSLALEDNVTGRDAPLVARLRASGVVILGKTNLSEWANIRSDHSVSGWSAVGGQTRNPHALDRSPCGSSSGSGAAVAAGLAWAAIGTETDGSVTCPASIAGIVGFKPTVGLVSRTHVVPISHSQDTPGPMTTSVRDAAMLLTAMAGSDPADSATAAADAHKADFAGGLDAASLKGRRIGVLRRQAGSNARVLALFDGALADLARAGAELVEIDFKPDEAMYRDEFTVLLTELRSDLGAYLAGLPGKPPVRSLADLIAFNAAHRDSELRWFGQDTFELAEKSTDRAAYEKARANSLRLAGVEGIDKLLRDNRVELLVAPTEGPAWPIDMVTESHGLSGIGAGSLAAIAGYPHLTVPMGAVEGLPVGLSLIGAAWDDKRVLEAGAAYERTRTAPLAAPSFRRWGE